MGGKHGRPMPGRCIMEYMEDVSRKALESALARWKHAGQRHRADRDPLVHEAFSRGISKSEIHRLTGISRATIDRILEPPA